MHNSSGSVVQAYLVKRCDSGARSVSVCVSVYVPALCSISQDSAILGICQQLADQQALLL